jgi:hypothetical protein
MSRYSSLYQINTRVWLTELSGELGRRATLDDIPDTELDRFAAMGFEWIWLLSVWETGSAGRQVSRTNAEWRREFKQTLEDLSEDDIGGSGFAITGYTVSQLLGGDAALSGFRDRLKARGIKLMLDFVPNHTGLDHPWVKSHPEYYISGTKADLEQAPQNYTRVQSTDRILAHGRDPYFPGWPDTLQLDYSNAATQEAMLGELLRISAQCDGVRCDMAMLVLPDVFERTWGRRSDPFWSRAITQVRRNSAEFCFMAEVYWDLEWTLQQQGFNYAYDKRLYDRLREGHAHAAREHFHAGLDYQNKLSRFLENHDEPRAAATFDQKTHEAAAVITFLSPGLRFFHQGQFEGRKKRISPHLVRAPIEEVNGELKHFYDRLLSALRLDTLREGQWQLLECTPGWEGNPTSESFIVFAWNGASENRLLVTVNYAANQGQCYVPLPFKEFAGRSVGFNDLMSSARYLRAGNDVVSKGLYLDLPAWGYHVFEMKVA